MAATSRDATVVDLSDYRRRLAQPGTAPEPVAGPVVFFWMPVFFLMPLWRLG